MVKVKTSRISEIADKSALSDWSALTGQILSLQPGRVLTLTYPPSISINKLRTTALTIAKRKLSGEWRLTTRKDGNQLHLFLVQQNPKSEV